MMCILMIILERQTRILFDYFYCSYDTIINLVRIGVNTGVAIERLGFFVTV